jgi:cation diffusion facilitator CzcD-associated flavoprotein CzcO
VLDKDFAIPRTSPSKTVENPITVAGAAAQFVSPVYDSLETNIPHNLMNFSDQPFPQGTSLFPRRQIVKEYLENYAVGLESFISLSTQVLEVKKEEGRRWAVKTLDLKTKETSVTLFDAVLVASGHYSDPFIPDIPGLAEFSQVHPASVSHSKFYKNPSALANKVVLNHQGRRDSANSNRKLSLLGIRLRV